MIKNKNRIKKKKCAFRRVFSTRFYLERRKKRKISSYPLLGEILDLKKVAQVSLEKWKVETLRIIQKTIREQTLNLKPQEPLLKKIIFRHKKGFPATLDKVTLIFFFDKMLLGEIYEW